MCFIVHEAEREHPAIALPGSIQKEGNALNIVHRKRDFSLQNTSRTFKRETLD